MTGQDRTGQDKTKQDKTNLQDRTMTRHGSVPVSISQLRNDEKTKNAHVADTAEKTLKKVHCEADTSRLEVFVFFFPFFSATTFFSSYDAFPISTWPSPRRALCAKQDVS